MPKMKTHRGAAGRFSVTKNGKLLRGHAKLNHLLQELAWDAVTHHPLSGVRGGS